MPSILLIPLIYLLFTLAMLVFRPVRRAWRELYCVCKDAFAELDLYGFVTDEPTLWRKAGMAIVCTFIYLLAVALSILVFVFFSFVVYYLAFRERKTKSKEAERGENSHLDDNLARQYFLKWCSEQSSISHIPSWEKWGAKIDQSFVEFDKDLPFTPSTYEVIYVEDQYNPAVNKYILQHYDELCKLFLSQCLTFNYLPAVNKQVVQEEVLRYLYPYKEQFDTVENGEITLDDLRRHLVSGDFVGPALIHFRPAGKAGSEKYYFSYRPLVPRSLWASLEEQFKWYVHNVSFASLDTERTMAHIDIEDDDKADFHFHNECFDPFTASTEWDLIDEIRERVFALRKRGLQLHWIQEMIEMPPKLSRLVVDKEFRIFLPDYNNMEITMSPLPKAVYLLFLKHPEGIPFKLLNDYYAELLDIYKQISNRVVETTVEKSIRDIADPTKNSINEKCARIREAFISKFDTLYAQHYYITGKRGEPKKIDLPRDLVDLQAL